MKIKIFFTKSARKLIIFIMIALGVLFLLWPICSEREEYGKSGKAQSEINSFLTALIAFELISYSKGGESLEQLFPRNMMGSMSTSVFLPVLMGANTPEAAAINSEQKVFINIHANRIKNGEFLDPWGRPYYFFFDTRDNVVKTYNGKTTSIFGNFYMWSNGPNGINEWGEGDDICSWKSPHEKTWWRVFLGWTGKKFLDNFTKGEG